MSEYRRHKSDMEQMRERLLQNERRMVRREVENVLHFVEHERRSRAVYLEEDREAIKQKALEMISEIRFGEEGYVFVLNYDGTILTSAHTEDPTGEVVNAIIDTVEEHPGGGFVEYHWPKLSDPTRTRKISYVSPIPEWEWIIGAGFYFDVIEETIRSREEVLTDYFRSAIITAIFVLFLVIVVAIFIGRLFVTNILQAFQTFIDDLEASIGESRTMKVSEQKFLEFQHVSKSLNEVLLEKAEAEREVAASARRYKEFADSLPQIVFELKKDGEIIFANRNAYSLLGYSYRKSVRSISFLNFVHGPERGRVIREFNRLLVGETAYMEDEYTLKRKDGSTFVAVVHLSPVERNNQIIGARGVLVDISETKRISKELAKSLKEKEVLLREVHHRTKNNLQIISSILNMQTEAISDPHAQTVLHDCQSRVHSIALVHEQLYQDEHITNIEMDRYINDLIGYIGAAQGETIERSISIDVEVEDQVHFDIEKAIPCGLLINEIVSNSLKHAFKGRETGWIHVRLRRNPQEYVLEISDDGVGIPEDFNPEQSSSLGMNLITSLTRQLGGKFTLLREEGITWTIEF